jgi:hypothetical protein
MWVKGICCGILNGMILAVMWMKDGRVKSVGSRAGDQRTNSLLSRIYCTGPRASIEDHTPGIDAC